MLFLLYFTSSCTGIYFSHLQLLLLQILYCSNSYWFCFCLVLLSESGHWRIFTCTYTYLYVTLKTGCWLFSCCISFVVATIYSGLLFSGYLKLFAKSFAISDIYSDTYILKCLFIYGLQYNFGCIRMYVSVLGVCIDM